MVDSIYHDKLLSEYRHPRNYGLKDDFNVEVKGSNPLCGDSIVIRLKMDKQIINDVCFENEGCVISRAAASLLSENIKGKKIDEIKNAGLEDMLSLLGIKVSLSRIKCAVLALETIQKAL